MISNQKFQAILAIDLDRIKAKLMHHQAGEGWSRLKVDTVEIEYRRFLYLAMAFPEEQIIPLEDVDTFWHYHILDTRKYAEDCDAIFGHFLHHFPYSGLRGDDDAAQHDASSDRMHVLYAETFDANYAEAAVGIANADHAMASGQGSTVEGSSAYCLTNSAGKAKPAYCLTDSASKAKFAYCLRDSASQAKQAYCLTDSAGQAKSAYCLTDSASQAKPAYCLTDSASKATSAYCLRDSASQAKMAYCLIGSPRQSKSAYCLIGNSTQSKLAYCLTNSRSEAASNARSVAMQ